MKDPVELAPEQRGIEIITCLRGALSQGLQQLGGDGKLYSSFEALEEEFGTKIDVESLPIRVFPGKVGDHVVVMSLMAIKQEQDR